MGFEKDLKISCYMDKYGDFLTDKQRRAMELYYLEDYSLAEISEETGVTRQGVLDMIKRSENKLIKMESMLHLVDGEPENNDGV